MSTGETPFLNRPDMIGRLDALDRPVWNSLYGRQAHLARWVGEAVRIDSAFGPFAAAAPGREEALAGLLTDGADEIWLVEPQPVAAPKGMQVLRVAPLVQMVADAPMAPLADDMWGGVLGEADAVAMARLAIANAPGPWAESSHRYGQFYGVRHEGALIAMAGERMLPGHGLAEVSGVCTDPAFRGRGLAAMLIRRVMAGLVARGDVPFLHSYAGNAGAIRLYEQLGFRVRREMVATVLALD